MTAYDAIVLGVGGMGSAALYHLAKRGLKVAGVEQFEIAHDRGSSHGETRIIRKAYFEHPDYVPLLQRAYWLWSELERESGERLFWRTGLLEMGRPDSALIRGVRLSTDIHRLWIEDVPLANVARRFPGFAPSPDMEAIFEADAGLLRVEQCVREHVRLARSLGAVLFENEAVREWTADGTDVVVRTDRTRITAKHLVICGGPWATELLARYALPLSIRRKPVFWYEAKPGAYRIDQGCPVFCFDTPSGFYYGLPTFEGSALKVAEHSRGNTVSHADQVDRGIHASDEAPVRAFAARHLPDVLPRCLKTSICMYTMTPDEHFILDCDSELRIAYATGFSGHGFKFAPVVGSILADFVTNGRTTEPIEFLSAARPALRAKVGPTNRAS